MKDNDNIIRVNGVEPPLHLVNEPGKYIGFINKVNSIILNDLNSGTILEVTMPNKSETAKLLIDLKITNIIIEDEYIIKIEENILIVSKRITYKIGI